MGDSRPKGFSRWMSGKENRGDGQDKPFGVVRRLKRSSHLAVAPDASTAQFQADHLSVCGMRQKYIATVAREAQVPADSNRPACVDLKARHPCKKKRQKTNARHAVVNPSKSLHDAVTAARKCSTSRSINSRSQSRSQNQGLSAPQRSSGLSTPKPAMSTECSEPGPPRPREISDEA